MIVGGYGVLNEWFSRSGEINKGGLISHEYCIARRMTGLAASVALANIPAGAFSRLLQKNDGEA